MPKYPYLLPAIVLTLLSVSTAIGQSPVAQVRGASDQGEGKKEVTVDSSVIRMEERTLRYMNMMDSLDRATSKSNGYRIQVFSASGPNARKDALEKQAEFLKLYNDGRAYTKWNYPNWVVRLGDFRTQLQALEFHHEIRELYPASFIVKDEINVDP